jgi:pimeloyl-ACP methyl ester carboxylesterase
MSPFPKGLHVVDRPPEDGSSPLDAPVVVLVHGSLDRAASFRRVARRLPDLELLTYDRRGYQGSRGEPGDPAPTLGTHVEDLLGIVAAVRDPGRRVTAIGHSLGGVVVMAAAIAEPASFASIGLYEAPMPWLGFRRSRSGAPQPWPSVAEDPAVEAERFFRRQVGDATWERLPESSKDDKRADGPALASDLRSIRGRPPFDVAMLSVPAVFAHGGPSSQAHHHRTMDYLAAEIPGAIGFAIHDAGHGAHLSSPDAFAEFVRAAVAQGSRAGAGASRNEPQSETR